MALTYTTHDEVAPAEPSAVVAVGDYLVCVCRDSYGAPADFNGSGIFSVLHVPTMTSRAFTGLDGHDKEVQGIGVHQGDKVFTVGDGSGAVGSGDLCLIDPVTGGVINTGESTGDARIAVSVGDWVYWQSGTTLTGYNTETATRVSAGGYHSLDAMASVAGRLFQRRASDGFLVEVNPATATVIDSWDAPSVGISYFTGVGAVIGSTIWWPYNNGVAGFNISTEEWTLTSLTPPGALYSNPLTPGPDGYLYSVYIPAAPDALVVINPANGHWKSEELPLDGHARASNVAVHSGKLWTASGFPFTV